MKSILRSESGYAFLLAIIVIGIMLLSLVAVAGNYFMNLSVEGTRARWALALTEVTQNLAVEIRRGYDQRNGLGGCTVAGEAVTINGYNYCLPPQVCVANPLGGLDSGAAGDQICWDRATFIANISYSEPPSLHEKFYAHVKNGLYNIGKWSVETVGLLTGQAVAQNAGMESYMPVLPAAAGTAVTLANLNCAAGDSEHCLRCDNASWSATGLTPACVLLNICMSLDPVARPCTGARASNLMRQWIAIERQVY